MAGERATTLIPDSVRLILGSTSPGRLATLRRAGIDPQVIVSGVKEDLDEPHPARHALTLAVRKADAVAAMIADETEQGGADRSLRLLVLGCDSVLDLDGEIHGKPRDAIEAVTRWQRMRGRSGVLHTGHCLIDVRTGRRTADVAATTVWFADISDDEITAYIATGEPLRVAGAFTLDGLGGAFVTRVEGDPHNVVGLSLPLLRTMLAGLGVSWTSLWNAAPTPE
jgi:septum formation protein